MTFREFASELDVLGLIHLRCASNGHRRAAGFIESHMRVLIAMFPEHWQLYLFIESLNRLGGEV